MTRDQAKIQMRAELEKDLSTEEREEPMMKVGDRTFTANDLMAEVEKGTEVGEALLDDFIRYQEIIGASSKFGTNSQGSSDSN